MNATQTLSRRLANLYPVDVIRYSTALVLIVALCAIAWRLTTGRWKWFAAAVTFHSLLGMFVLANAQQIDSWGIVPGAAWLFLLTSLAAAVLVIPAIALWPSSGKSGVGALFSIALVLIWALWVNTSIVYGVWDRWQVCIFPGVYYGPENGGPSCELGPS